MMASLYAFASVRLCPEDQITVSLPLQVTHVHLACDVLYFQQG